MNENEANHLRNCTGTWASSKGKLWNCDDIETLLNEELAQGVTWKVKIEVDSFTGASEKIEEISKQAVEIKKSNNWDYVISLTDLPIFFKESIILSNVDINEKIALISLPALGAMPTKKKVKKTIHEMVKELYYGEESERKFQEEKWSLKQSKEKKMMGKLTDVFQFLKIKRQEVNTIDEGASVRFVLQPMWMGRIKVVSGMTVANRPWLIMPSFKKIMGTAFATGSYMLIFTTLWQLSGLYNWSRFIMLMLFATVGMITWIIFAHNLWEKKTNYNSQRLRFLYNTTTIVTLSVSMLIFYLAMFLLFVFAVVIFVPIDLFEDELKHDVHLVDYLRLAWLVASTSTVAGAIGASLENEQEVRKTAYGYRQYIRSEKIKAQEEKEEEHPT